MSIKPFYTIISYWLNSIISRNYFFFSSFVENGYPFQKVNQNVVYCFELKESAFHYMYAGHLTVVPPLQDFESIIILNTSPKFFDVLSDCIEVWLIIVEVHFSAPKCNRTGSWKYHKILSFWFARGGGRREPNGLVTHARRLLIMEAAIRICALLTEHIVMMRSKLVHFELTKRHAGKFIYSHTLEKDAYCNYGFIALLSLCANWIL